MAIHYSIENMDKIILCRTFNYSAYHPLYQLLLKSYRRFLKISDGFTLGDTYRMFQKGETVQDILNDHPNLSMRAILIGRTFYNLQNPDVYRPKLQRRLNVMIDENIDLLHSVDGGMQTLGYTSHVAFAGLMGAKDTTLWKYCLAHGINILVTKDKTVNLSRNTKETMDITRCAILAWKRAMKENGGIVNNNMRMMPVILHVPHDATPTQIKNLLRKHQKTILDIYDERVSPVIELSKGKVKPGIHFMEILGGDLKKQSERLRNLRVEVLIGNFDLKPLSQKQIKEKYATLKCAVDHEISQELQPIQGDNNRIVYLHEAEASFDPSTYNYSGPMDKIQDAYKRAVIGDPLLIPIQDRLAARIAQKAANMQPTMA